MYPKVGLVEETEEKKKKTRILNNNEIQHICVGIRNKETCQKMLNNTH
jgi:hypothetical protein